MTTLTALTHSRADLDLPERPPFAGLLRAEVRRLTARRSLRLVAAAVLVGVLVAMVAAFATHSKDDAAARAAAVQAREQNRAGYLDMLDHMSAEERAAQPPVDEAIGNLDNYFQDPRFHFVRELSGLAQALAGAMLLVGLTVGASAVGAEWSAKTMSGLLVWEPRRARVFAAKALAALSVVLALTLVAAVLLLGLAAVVAALRGDFAGPVISPAAGVDAAGTRVPPELASPVADGVWTLVRGVPLVVGGTVLGTSLAFLLRSTAAVLGVAFAYLALVETAVRGLEWDVVRFLLTNQVAGWLLPHGTSVYLQRRVVSPNGSIGMEGAGVHIGHGQAGLILVGVTVVAALLGLTFFRRRDIG